MNEVPPHFHEIDRISERNLIPNPQVYSALPVSGVEGERVVVFDGADYTWYQYLDGAWQQMNTTPAAPATSIVAKMWLSTSQNIVDGNQIKVAFDTDSFPPQGITTDTSNNRFTVPEDGYYHIHAQVPYGAPNTDQKILTQIIINGVTASPRSDGSMVAYNPSSAFIMGPTVDDVLLLDASDTIEIYTFHAYFSAPALTLQAGEEYSFCYVHKL